MKRRDCPAIRDTALYYGAMIILTALTIRFWPSGWARVPFIGYAGL